MIQKKRGLLSSEQRKEIKGEKFSRSVQKMRKRAKRERTDKMQAGKIKQKLQRKKGGGTGK